MYISPESAGCSAEIQVGQIKPIGSMYLGTGLQVGHAVANPPLQSNPTWVQRGLACIHASHFLSNHPLIVRRVPHFHANIHGTAARVLVLGVGFLASPTSPSHITPTLLLYCPSSLLTFIAVNNDVIARLYPIDN